VFDTRLVYEHPDHRTLDETMDTERPHSVGTLFQPLRAAFLEIVKLMARSSWPRFIESKYYQEVRAVCTLALWMMLLVWQFLTVEADKTLAKSVEMQVQHIFGSSSRRGSVASTAGDKMPAKKRRSTSTDLSLNTDMIMRTSSFRVQRRIVSEHNIIPSDDSTECAATPSDP
jgi:hypothetical protein